jgi:hypothetical protein
VLKKQIPIVFAPKFTNLFAVAMVKRMETNVKPVAIILQSLRKENVQNKAIKMKKLIRFIALLFTAITLSALMAHLLEMRIKMQLSKADYQTVQGIYSGWQWLGIFELGAILLTIIWAVFDRKSTVFPFLLSALICFALSIIIFFVFTFPTNQETLNWTSLPDNWAELRKIWEYSHAIRALLSLCGFSFLVLALLKKS